MFPNHEMNVLAVERMLRDRLEANIKFVDRQAGRTEDAEKSSFAKLFRIIPLLRPRRYE